MVDMHDNWTAEENYNLYPKHLWCDCDYVAVWIKKQGYNPKTSIENLVEMIILLYEGYLYDNDRDFYTDISESENGIMISIIDVSCFVEDNGGLKEFDYEY